MGSILPFVLLALLCACGGSSSSSRAATDEDEEPLAPPTGTLLLAVASNPHPALESVELTLVGATLVGASPHLPLEPGGAEDRVSLLPVPLPLELRREEEHARGLTATEVPVGDYTHLVLDLLLSSAEAHPLEGGQALGLVDRDGLALGGVEGLSVELFAPLPLLEDRDFALIVDLDLERSITIDGDRAWFEPVLEVRVDGQLRPMVFEGFLLDDGSARVRLLGPGDELLGELVGTTRDTTRYELNGSLWSGAGGAALLEQQGFGTRVELFVRQEAAGELRIDAVRAGRSTRRGCGRYVDGYVVAVGQGAEGPDLFVRSLERGEDRVRVVRTDLARTRFLQGVESTVAAPGFLTVGQRVQVHGEDLEDEPDVVDAAGYPGIVRLEAGRWTAVPMGPVQGSTLRVAASRVGPFFASGLQWGTGGSSPHSYWDLPLYVPPVLQGLDVVPVPFARVGLSLYPATGDPTHRGLLRWIEQPGAGPVLLRLRDRVGGRSVGPDLAGTLVTLHLSGAPGAGEVFLLDRAEAGSSELGEGPLVLDDLGADGPHTLRRRGSGEVLQTFSFAELREHWVELAALGARLEVLEARGEWLEGPRRLVVDSLSLVLD